MDFIQQQKYRFEKQNNEPDFYNKKRKRMEEKIAASKKFLQSLGVDYDFPIKGKDIIKVIKKVESDETNEESDIKNKESDASNKDSDKNNKDSDKNNKDSDKNNK